MGKQVYNDRSLTWCLTIRGFCGFYSLVNKFWLAYSDRGKRTITIEENGGMVESVQVRVWRYCAVCTRLIKTTKSKLYLTSFKSITKFIHWIGQPCTNGTFSGHQCHRHVFAYFFFAKSLVDPIDTKPFTHCHPYLHLLLHVLLVDFGWSNCLFLRQPSSPMSMSPLYNIV